MHTSADSIFYKNYLLHYVNILHHLDHDLVRHNNRIECIKNNLHIKCRTFVSGLHILARNENPESILHADVFSNILRGISLHLSKDNIYTLLYGTSVNLYYVMKIIKCFILNKALYMTISLPLKHHRAPIMSLYGLFSYHLPTNMSDGKVFHPHTLNYIYHTLTCCWITTLTNRLCTMIICMFNKNHYYSEEQIETVM